MEPVSRSWFCVFNNPRKHGFNGTEEEILQQLADKWIGNNSSRKCIMTYCISEKGLEHVHMVLEGSGAIRFSAIKKVFDKANLQATRGSKKQVLDYIAKNPPYDEKNEKVIATFSKGNIEGNKLYYLKTKNDVYDLIEKMIDEDKTPSEIMSEDIRLRKEETLVKKMFFAKRCKEIPPLRDVKVYWHTGDSGTGKSFTFVQLCEKYSEDEVYLFNDYSNKGTGGFDEYAGQRILFIDELKRSSLSHEYLLTILDGYKTQIHCRYANSYALWNEVHITSIFPPEDIYTGFVIVDDRDIDNFKQLMRRIDYVVYHYKVGDEYKTYSIDSKNYTNINELKKHILLDGFTNSNNINNS